MKQTDGSLWQAWSEQETFPRQLFILNRFNCPIYLYIRSVEVHNEVEQG